MLAKPINEDKKYSEASLGYIAGIIDGEGSLTICNCSKTQGRAFFTTSLNVSSTDKILIDWIVEQFGGWQGEYTPKQTPKNSRKKVYRWAATGKNLEVILRLAYPYVVIKKREIEVMLAMRKTFKGRGLVNKLSPETIALRKKYSDELKSLHCRNYKNKK